MDDPTDPLIELARQLSDEEHDDLTYRRERLSGWKLESFDEDWRYEEDPEDHWERNRDYWLEKARKIIAQEAA